MLIQTAQYRKLMFVVWIYQVVSSPNLPTKPILHFSCFGFHTSELKRIWQTLQEIIGLFVFTIGGPKVCVITAFWTGSIWGEKTQRLHQRFSSTWEIQTAAFLQSAERWKVQLSKRGQARKLLKKKYRWMIEGAAEAGMMLGHIKEKVWIEEWATIDVDRKVRVFSEAAGAAACSWILGCSSNALFHAWFRWA